MRIAKFKALLLASIPIPLMALTSLLIDPAPIDVPHIHRSYLSWINNVVLDINVQLQAAAAALAPG